MSCSEITHFHLFAGIGGGAAGYNNGRARVGPVQASFRCLGGVDVDPLAIQFFSQNTGARGTVLDLFSREQYEAWHEEEPPRDWREATAEDLRRAAGGESPDIVFTSPPCKGFSGLLAESRSRSRRYRALNELAFRSLMLSLEAWGDDPPCFFLLENVPRMQQRGGMWIEAIRGLLGDAGYSVTPSSHCCGEIGGLGQRRQRFLLVARHREKVPPYLFEPPRRPLLSVGDVLGKLPLPDDPRGGPMHASRRLQWKTWLRLALIPPGKDWRALNELAGEDGVLRDLGVVPLRGFLGTYGVGAWDEPSATVTGRCAPSCGRFSIADPRPPGPKFNNAFRIVSWSLPAVCVTGGAGPSAGGQAIADPRLHGQAGSFGSLGVRDWSEPSGTVTAGAAPGSGAFTIADPRLGREAYRNVFAIIRWDEPSRTITGSQRPASGSAIVADPRRPWPVRGTWSSRGTDGVLSWQEPAPAVTASAGHDNGRFSVADPRVARVAVDQDAAAEETDVPGPSDRGIWTIIALDGTWHRPLTTLELAALQGFVDPENPAFVLPGEADYRWRQWIGNAVPPPSAAAVASVMGSAILLARTGESFALASTPHWARPLATAVSLDEEAG